MELLVIPKQFFLMRKLTPLRRDVGQQVAIFENDAVQFWKVYFDFTYWLLLIPFRFTFNPFTGTYEMKRNRIQKVLIFINYTLVSIYFVFKLRSKVRRAHQPQTYFEITYYICDTLYLIVMFYAFGRQWRDMLSIFNEVQLTNFEFDIQPRAYTAKKLRATLICFLCICCVLWFILEVLLDAQWSLDLAWSVFELDAKNTFSEVLSLLNLPCDSSSIFLTFLSFWSAMFETILNVFSDILFTMTALWFHSLVCSFQKISQDVANSPERVIECYIRVKRLVQHCSHSMSLIIGSFVIGNLPFYVTNVFEIFSDGNAFLRLRYLFYCSYYFPSIFLAARSCRKMEEMTAWVSQIQNVQHMPLLDITLLLNEVNYQPVALESFGCFRVNFSLLGSIISVILTYALVKSQFQSGEHPSSGK